MQHIIVAAIITALAFPATADPLPRGNFNQGSSNSEVDDRAEGVSFRYIFGKFVYGHVLGGAFGVVGLFTGAEKDEVNIKGFRVGYLAGTSLGVSMYDLDTNFPLSFAGGVVGSVVGLTVVARTENATLFWVGLPALTAAITSEMSRLLLRDSNLSVDMRPNAHGQWFTTVWMRS